VNEEQERRPTRGEDDGPPGGEVVAGRGDLTSIPAAGPLAHAPGEPPPPDVHAGIDVSHLKEVEFGARSLMWWGSFGFILVEGISLAIVIVAYFYLRLNAYEWPPPPVSDPDLLIPTLNTLLMMAVVLPMRFANRAAHAFDRAGVGLWLSVAGAMTLVATVLRGLEFSALDVRWDTNAYGSIVWALLLLHTTLLVADLLETGVVAAMFISGHAQKKHYSDASDAALYQYFLSAAAVPVYLVIYWAPRWM
jgi:cytochrome c oxidase subunit III